MNINLCLKKKKCFGSGFQAVSVFAPRQPGGDHTLFDLGSNTVMILDGAFPAVSTCAPMQPGGAHSLF